MMGQQGGIDALQGKVPPILKWCLAGMGGVAGFSYAQQHGSPIPQSCIVAGAAAGFLLVVVLFAGLRLVKLALIGAAVLVVLNYAVLVPYGYGDHSQSWIMATRSATAAVLDAVIRLVDSWGRNAR